MGPSPSNLLLHPRVRAQLAAQPATPRDRWRHASGALPGWCHRGGPAVFRSVAEKGARASDGGEAHAR